LGARVRTPEAGLCPPPTAFGGGSLQPNLHCLATKKCSSRFLAVWFPHPIAGYGRVGASGGGQLPNRLRLSMPALAGVDRAVVHPR